jgi:tRNA A37 threonylcarbamoyltransferase TsaD
MLITGAHTEIVLNRGVGLHTILGMTIDSAAGECFDKASVVLKKYEKILLDVDAQNEFIEKYNKRVKQIKVGSIIPADHFAFLNKPDQRMSRGRYIELLAKYGDASALALPIGLQTNQNADFSYTGLKTKIQSVVS